MNMIKNLRVQTAGQKLFAVKKHFAFAGLAGLFFAVLAANITAQTTFNNPATINIPSSGTATPSYPSTINVSGLTGRVTLVTVRLNGFTHALPDDVGVLLVGPTGEKVRMMADVGGSTSVSGVNITLDDRAASFLPDNSALTTGTFKPTLGQSASAGDGNTHPASFPAPAPAAPYAGSLAGFIGMAPNGTWSLYVDDDTSSNAGSISGGWTLSITTGGVFTNANQITINDNVPATPYPSAITVSGFTGSITKVSVRLNNFSHTFLDDVGILLVSPSGTAVRITTDNGGSNDAVNLDITFDDTAANALPDNAVFFSTTYQPSPDGAANGGSVNHPANFPAPAPAGPYPNTFSSFNGSNPNGTWSLYVNDDTALDIGAFAGGWTLAIEAAAPTAAGANISGRVVNSAGSGLGKVGVTLFGGNLAEPLHALTNPFGYYTFENVAAGQTYVISVSSKRYRFSNPAQVLNLGEDLAEIDFVAEP